ncbi:MAG: hypothetical protein R2766_07955 [Saprospiraceae bacterium]
MTTIPSTREFEIVTTGLDPLIGIQQVRFGNKAARINNRYAHVGNTCNGNYGVDRLVKTFKVTEATRDLTVWYAVALENPNGHVNAQPFLNISCDRDPINELCFDASIIQCANTYYDSICGNSFDSIDVLNWACHRFKIPEDFVDSLATVEITVADCAAGAHFGYAYIDGFCEPCDSSSLGNISIKESTIDYVSCNAETARVCGEYILPSICQTNHPDSIKIPGYTIYNLEIDTATRTFCFDFPISNFGAETCLEIYAEIYFGSTGFFLPPQLSNSIDICKNLYEDLYDVNFVTGTCNDNNTDDLLSDDYYYVEVYISGAIGTFWQVTRELNHPYPNESGSHTIATGSGNTTLLLGPFLIQEGDWVIVLEIGNCKYTDYIEAPDYCSGCTEFNDLEIRNIQCHNTPSDYDPTNDTWSFEMKIPAIAPMSTYNISGAVTATSLNYNTWYSFSSFDISDECILIQIKDTNLSEDKCKWY